MYEFIYRSQLREGTSDPEPEPRQHYEVHCGRCGWWGLKNQLKSVYMVHERPSPACPICLSSEWLEYKEV